MHSEQRILLLKQYLLEDPADAFSKYALALEYLKSGDTPAALGLMEDLYAHQSDYLPNYYHYGKLLEQQGLPEKAHRVYEAGIRLARKINDVHTASELQGAADALDMPE